MNIRKKLLNSYFMNDYKHAIHGKQVFTFNLPGVVALCMFWWNCNKLIFSVLESFNTRHLLYANLVGS